MNEITPTTNRTIDPSRVVEQSVTLAFTPMELLVLDVAILLVRINTVAPRYVPVYDALRVRLDAELTRLGL
jgi:hypothetical protein